MIGIGTYKGNAELAIDCQLCDDPILPGHLHIELPHSATIHAQCAVKAREAA